MESERQTVVKDDDPAPGRHCRQQLLKPLDRSAPVIDTGNDFHVAGSGEVGEGRRDVPDPGALDERDRGSKVDP